MRRPPPRPSGGGGAAVWRERASCRGASGRCSRARSRAAGPGPPVVIDYTVGNRTRGLHGAQLIRPQALAPGFAAEREQRMVYTPTNPWTLKGRNTAIQKAVAAIYERYFAKGPRWVAKHLPERSQMREYGSKVSPESREILLGDYGVESFVEDYAVMAIRASGDSISIRQTYTQWIFDETRHSKALW